MLTPLRRALAAHLTAILMFRIPCPKTDMALLAEGENASLGSYIHDPPDGGQKVQTSSSGTTNTSSSETLDQP